ncbi:MAG TPA: hypothetical protein IGS53_26330 [Leptolyngbyaceae cyanobacterium M33_DOE_097]|uniref:Uncharacterized protein n=1 Tax=Oscillatoriales cyanobacterium SpSt-418 TaxID=2282169 RepID=A0A7C3PEM3_9CYAN|nr:hypothetical protein [Leptolyngbyaceae cyanobacterium M33_DOE_097]
MVPLRTKSFSILLLSLLMLVAGNAILVGCGRPGYDAESREESQNLNRSDDDEGDRNQRNRSSDDDDDDDEKEKDDDD